MGLELSHESFYEDGTVIAIQFRKQEVYKFGKVCHSQKYVTLAHNAKSLDQEFDDGAKTAKLVP